MHLIKISLLLGSTLMVPGQPPALGGQDSHIAREERVAGDQVQSGIPWNRRTVEHLYNRAAFGARRATISRALQGTPEAAVDQLLKGGRAVEPPHYSQGTVEDTKISGKLSREEKRRRRALRSRENRQAMEGYTNWWLERMVAHDDPLRDRMALFWHGLFATQYGMVKRSFDMIEQHQLIRENATESYAVLLHGIARDPAMLLFLDNQKNKKGNPNENLARELMELFSLGVGNYTEEDVKEVARALTGTSRDKIGNYKFVKKDHDSGRKTILGETGRFSTEDVVDILLRQTACARYIAGRIITYFEGVEPDELRLVEYAAFLQRKNYELQPFLRKLLLDPRFYREEVLESRVLGPVEYLVGSSRRLGIKVDGDFLRAASAELGQKLFEPPSVKGWDHGEAWINTGSLLARGNTIGLMIGTVDLEETFRSKKDRRSALDEPSTRRGTEGERVVEEELIEMDSEAADESTMELDIEEVPMEDETMGEVMMGEVAWEPELPKDELPKEISRLVNALGKDYQPVLNLSYRLNRRKIEGDERIVAVMLDDLLAIQVPGDTRSRLLEHFRLVREQAGIEESEFIQDPRAELILRQLAHLILSLPEAQLG